MDELIEPEVLEGELKEIIGMFRLGLTCGCELIRNLEIFIENRLDGIGNSSTKNILSVRDEFCGDTKNIGSRTKEMVRKSSSSSQ